MTQLMTRGRNLQLPDCQVILLISASEMQGKGAFKAFGHMAGIQSYRKLIFFFCIHSRAWIVYSSSECLRVILLPTNRFL